MRSLSVAWLLLDDWYRLWPFVIQVVIVTVHCCCRVVGWEGAFECIMRLTSMGPMLMSAVRWLSGWMDGL